MRHTCCYCAPKTKLQKRRRRELESALGASKENSKESKTTLDTQASSSHDDGLANNNSNSDDIEADVGDTLASDLLLELPSLQR